MGLDDIPAILTESVDLATLQGLQDGLAALAQVTMTICDAQGRLVTRPSFQGPLCSLVSESEAGRAACIEEIANLAAVASDQSKADGGTASATCHAGLRLVVIPIESDNLRLGTIVVGDRPDIDLDDNEPARLAEELGVERARVAAAVARLGVRSVEQREAGLRCAGLLASIIAQMNRQDRLLRDRVEELTAVYDITGLLADAKDLKERLNTVAGIVTAVMRVKACAIRLLDEATGELVMTAVHNLSAAYLNKGPVLRSENPIDNAALAGETVYIADSRTDPRIRYPDESRREGIVSGLAAPMRHHGRSVGVIRVYSGEPQEFSRFEASLLRAIGAQAAAVIVADRVRAQRAESERYHRQLRYAGEIQRRMIPAEPPAHAGLDFAGVYAPCLEVGGDFYDYLVLPGGNLGLCVADVVGGGVPAALLMASVRSALRGHAHSIYEINEIMTQVNQQLGRDTLVSEFATLFYGVFSPDGRRLTYCNAGHEPPLLLHGDEFRRLETGGMVIGVSEAATFDKEVVDLRRGDVLVFVTDGVTEALNFQGEQFGRTRLRESVLRHRQEKAKDIANQVLWDVRRFAGLAVQADDITVVVAKVAGGG